MIQTNKISNLTANLRIAAFVHVGCSGDLIIRSPRKNFISNNEIWSFSSNMIPKPLLKQLTKMGTKELRLHVENDEIKIMKINILLLMIKFSKVAMSEGN